MPKSPKQFSVLLNLFQRVVIAEIMPELSTAMAIDEVRSLNMVLTLDQTEGILEKARIAMPIALTGKRRETLRSIFELMRQAEARFSRMASSASAKQIYQFRIALTRIEPPVWRRIQVKNCSLDEFHEHIQTGMGWTNSHLHHFRLRIRLRRFLVPRHSL